MNKSFALATLIAATQALDLYEHNMHLEKFHLAEEASF